MTMEEYSKKQKREHLLTRLRKYYQSHLWCAFGTEILLALGVIILFMSSYMKNEYYEYLVETTMTTERVLLDSVSRNIRTQMEDFVNIGSGIAVDENLIEEIEQCLEKESEASKNKRMKNALESAASLSNHIVGHWPTATGCCVSTISWKSAEMMMRSGRKTARKKYKQRFSPSKKKVPANRCHVTRPSCIRRCIPMIKKVD